MDDLDAVARVDRMRAVLAARNDLPIDFDGDTLSPEAIRFKQHFERQWIGNVMGVAVERDVHRGILVH